MRLSPNHFLVLSPSLPIDRIYCWDVFCILQVRASSHMFLDVHNPSVMPAKQCVLLANSSTPYLQRKVLWQISLRSDIPHWKLSITLGLVLVSRVWGVCLRASWMFGALVGGDWHRKWMYVSWLPVVPSGASWETDFTKYILIEGLLCAEHESWVTENSVWDQALDSLEL